MKCKYLLPTLAVVTAMANPASAAIVVGGIGDTVSVPANFSFAGQIGSAYGLTVQASTLGGISLDAPARITFYALGSESRYKNTFSFEGLSQTEADYGYDPSRIIGSVALAAGSLGGLTFTSNKGATATPGTPGFAVFLPTGFSGTSFSADWLVFGYDDGGAKDGDYDDYLIGAQISAIPEPQVWAMMIAGFGLVGMQLRRNRNRHSLIAC